MAPSTFLLLLLGLAAVQAAPSTTDPQLPDIVNISPTCFRDDPDLDECMAQKLQKLLPLLADGAQELGLPSTDPHYLPEMLVQYKQGEVSGKMLVRNTRTMGMKGAQVTGLRSSLNDSNRFHMEVDLYFPILYIEGSYKAQGKMVVFPIEGKGVYNITMRGISATWNITGQHITKKGRDYVRVQHFTMFPEMEDMKIYASNLFTGNEDFNRAALQFANDFWPVIYNEMLPYANDAWDKVLTGMANKLLLKFPFQKIFPSRSEA